MSKTLNTFFKSFLALTSLGCMLTGAQAADMLSNEPIAQQEANSGAVDGVNWKFSLLGGAYQRNVLGSASNGMFTASVTSPLPYFSENFGFQIDTGIGIYDGEFTSAAAGLHIFYRDHNGLLGLYGDWGYVNPEHAGRVGVELSSYHGQFQIDALIGFQFGQHVDTGFIDEVDLAYYFTDDFKASIGHRLTSRGNVVNLAFESALPDLGYDGLSIFGEIEAGEDNYVGGFGGVRWALGSGSSIAGTLKERDRQSSVQVRIPRNIVSITQCGNLDNPKPATSLRSKMKNLCASEDEINDVSSVGIVKN